MNRLIKTQNLLIAAILILLLHACTGISGTERVEPAPIESLLTSIPTTPTTANYVPTPEIPKEKIRHPVVAGTWYPGDPNTLKDMVDTMLGAVTPVDGAPIAMIVPHAGYEYSGQVAAYGFKQLQEGSYEVAVIIAADHQAPISDPISVWAEGGFETPLGVVPIQTEIAEALIAADPHISFDPEAHAGEHAIEIELPFLQRVCPACSVVPILMGNDDQETVNILSQALLSTLPGKRVVLIASSDLSHYPSYTDAINVDGTTLGAIEAGDPKQVREITDNLMAIGIPNLVTCACGRGPILVTMQVALGLGANTISVLHYANSGDSPNGNQDQVVGYGAAMFWRYDPPELSEAERQELLRVARLTLDSYLQNKSIPSYETNDPVLNRLAGVFVTLKEGGNLAAGIAPSLRGCIGHLQTDTPLYLVVQQMAVQAATLDPRFAPLTTDELDDITIEISILSPFHLVTDLEKIRVGIDGLRIYNNGQAGIFLPQVATEQGWDLEELLDNLCRKANMPETCWQEAATIYSFTAVVFGEEP